MSTAFVSAPFRYALDTAPRRPYAPPAQPHLPPLIRTATGWAPQAPTTIDETGLDAWILHDLALKLTSTLPHLSTEWAADQLRLPVTLVERIFWQLKQDQFVEILGQTGEFGYRYAATDRGREAARRSMEVSGYVGPAPVSLGAYSAMLDWQSRQRPKAPFQTSARGDRVDRAAGGDRRSRGPRRAVQPQPLPLRPPRQRQDEPRPTAAHRAGGRAVDPLLLLPREQHHPHLRPADSQAARRRRRRRRRTRSPASSTAARSTAAGSASSRRSSSPAAK